MIGNGCHDEADLGMSLRVLSYSGGRLWNPDAHLKASCGIRPPKPEVLGMGVTLGAVCDVVSTLGCFSKHMCFCGWLQKLKTLLDVFPGHQEASLSQDLLIM